MATEEINNQQAFNNELQETRILINEIKNAFRGIGAEINDIIKNEMQNLEGSAKNIAKTIQQDLNKAINVQKTSTEDITKIINKQRNGSLKLSEVENLIAKTKQRQLNIEDLLLEAVSEGVLKEKDREKNIFETNEQYKIQLKLLDDARLKAEEFEKTLGITYKIFEGINKIPILNSFIKIEKVKEAMEESASKGKNAFQAFGTGVSTTFSQIGKSLKDPLVLLSTQVVLIKKFFDLYGNVNQRIVDQQKQLGISYESSQKLYESAYQYASEQRNAFVTEARILEGRHKLNEALGTSVAFSNEEAITAAKLSEYYGLSAEQNAQLVILGKGINQNNSSILDTVIKTTVNYKAQIGGTLSQQKILQKVSSTSGEILTRFKGNTQALTASVIQADKLGLNLEQVNKVSESLLNFESSIENELKAELLTGKAINLEKARSASLSGDTSKLITEIAKQTGGIHEFEKMNVIQRKAYAEAFGMEVGEMGDMLRKKEFEAKLGADAKNTAAEQLRIAKERGITIEKSVQKDLEATSLAEAQKFTFEKLQSILSKIASGPMATIYRYLEKGFSFAERISGAFSKMTGGALGNALGTAVLAAPLLLGSARLIIGTASSIFKNGLTPLTAPWVRVANSMGGAGGASQFAGGSLSGGRGMVAQRQMMGKVGMGLAGVGVGMLTSGITSNMEEGGGKNTVSVLGGAASGALMGAAFGPYGALIGGLIGGVGSLISVLGESEERKKAETAKKEEAEKKTQDLLEQLSVRPIALNVNNDQIGKWNTASSQNGSNPKFG
jgi:hypothetical protein